MADGTPKTPKEVLQQVKYEYQAGTYKSVAELAERYGINQFSLHSRIKREKWDEKKEQILAIAEKNIEKAVLSEANEWINRVKTRSLKDWQIIDSSIDGMVAAAGGVEPSDLRSYIQARKVLDDMSRRALGLADPSQNVDITSKGQSIGESLISAIAKLRETEDRPRLTEEDKRRILEAEIIDE